MKSSFYYIIITPILIFIFFLIIPSWYIINEKIIYKNNQLNQIFENWLSVKAEIAFLLLKDYRNDVYDENKDNHVIDGITNFEKSLENLLDEEIFKIIEKKNVNMRNYRADLITEWINIQLKLVNLVSHGRDLSFYANELYFMICEAPSFEKNLDDIIYFTNYYSKKKYSKNILMILFLSSVILLLYFNFIRKVFLIQRVKISEKEIKEMSKVLIKIKEIERKKIALEIHDVLIQKLTQIKKHFELMKNKITEKEFVDIESEMFESIQMARNISFSLRPFEMKDDLVNSIKYYCAEISWRHDKKINTNISGFNDVLLSEDIENNIFRIIQELITNINNHSKANIVDLNLIYSNPFILLTISDNGIGVPGDIIKKLNKNEIDIEHMGLQGIKDRVNLFDGSFSIKSNFKNGTFIRIKIPYNTR